MYQYQDLKLQAREGPRIILRSTYKSKKHSFLKRKAVEITLVLALLLINILIILHPVLKVVLIAKLLQDRMCLKRGLSQRVSKIK